MNNIHWLVSGILLLVFLIVAAANWTIPVLYLISRKKMPSAVFLVGGLCGAIGIYFLPLEGFRRYFWLPLLFDWGCAPVIIHALLRRFVFRKEESDNK